MISIEHTIAIVNIVPYICSEYLFVFYGKFGNWHIKNYLCVEFYCTLVVLFLEGLYFILLLISNNSFIESVRFRSMRNACFKFVVDILRSFAISERVDFSESPFWSF